MSHTVAVVKHARTHQVVSLAFMACRMKSWENARENISRECEDQPAIVNVSLELAKSVTRHARPCSLGSGQVKLPVVLQENVTYMYMYMCMYMYIHVALCAYQLSIACSTGNPLFPYRKRRKAWEQGYCQYCVLIVHIHVGNNIVITVTVETVETVETV